MAKSAAGAARHGGQPVLRRHRRGRAARPDYAIVGEVTDGLDVVDASACSATRSSGRRSPSSSTRSPSRRPDGVSAVVLAAGEATRFGSPKQRLLLPPCSNASARRRWTRSSSSRVRTSSTSRLGLDGAPVRVVQCDEWARGPGASLRCGLAALGPEVEAAVVVLADGPDLVPESISRVLDAWRAEGGSSPRRTTALEGTRWSWSRDWEDVPDEGLHGRAGAPRALRRPRRARRRRHARRPSAAPRAAGALGLYAAASRPRSSSSFSISPGGIRSTALVRT